MKTFEQWWREASHRRKYSTDHPAYLAAQEAWQAAAEAAKATGTAGEQDGWKTVPRKMTDEQAKETAYNINRKYKVAGPLSDFLVRQIWELGIYASPNPPAEAARQPAPVVAESLTIENIACMGFDTFRILQGMEPHTYTAQQIAETILARRK